MAGPVKRLSRRSERRRLINFPQESAGGDLSPRPPALHRQAADSGWKRQPPEAARGASARAVTSGPASRGGIHTLRRSEVRGSMTIEATPFHALPRRQRRLAIYGASVVGGRRADELESMLEHADVRAATAIHILSDVGARSLSVRRSDSVT